MDRVEILSAFKWTCVNCGQLNFHPGISAELSAEESYLLMSQLRAEMPDADWEPNGVVIMAPDEVECSRCVHQFKTNTDGEEGADPTELFPKP